MRSLGSDPACDVSIKIVQNQGITIIKNELSGYFLEVFRLKIKIALV